MRWNTISALLPGRLAMTWCVRGTPIFQRRRVQQTVQTPFSASLSSILLLLKLLSLSVMCLSVCKADTLGELLQICYLLVIIIQYLSRHAAAGTKRWQSAIGQLRHHGIATPKLLIDYILENYVSYPVCEGIGWDWMHASHTRHRLQQFLVDSGIENI